MTILGIDMLGTVIKEAISEQTYWYLGIILFGIIVDIPLLSVVMVLSSIVTIIIILSIANYVLNNPRG
jgi:hypothetical protein